MNKEAGEPVFWGGLVVRENNLWHMHGGEDCSYAPGKLGEGWTRLTF